MGKALISITLVPKRITTAATRFAECPMHSAKAPMHSANPLLSTTLGKEAPSNIFTVKPALLSAKSRALGKGFAECQAGTRQRIDGRWPKAHAVLIFFLFLCQVQHSAKNFLFFSKFFAECHSAEALGKACFYFFIFFAECHCQGTRQSIFYLFFKFSLPSAMAIALGKSGKLLLLFSQLCRVQWSLHSAKPQQFFFVFCFSM